MLIAASSGRNFIQLTRSQKNNLAAEAAREMRWRRYIPVFSAISRLQKRIHNPHTVHHQSVVHILAKKYSAAGTLRTTKMERIKVRESVQAVNIYSSKNVRYRGLHQGKLGIKLYLTARNAGIQMQLPHCSREILP